MNKNKTDSGYSTNNYIFLGNIWGNHIHDGYEGGYFQLMGYPLQ